MIAIDRALRDPALLGAALGGNAGSWSTWIATLKAAFGLSLSETELTAFHSVAGDRSPPSKRVRELWCVVGRRGGKSKMSAAIAVYLACFVKHNLSPGETGYVLVLASSLSQARIVCNYALAFLQNSPVLRQEIASVTATEIRLHNNVVISSHANSFRSVRGRTLVAAVLDETAFWRDEMSATPDIEVYRAIRPSLATTDGMIVGISTPYRRTGLLHAKHRDHFGNDSDDMLVVQGPSITFNPQLTAARIAQEMKDDPEGNAAEWLAEFRSDLSAFLSDQLIEDAIQHARPLELPPRRDKFYYKAFVDPSGGRHDHFTVCIGHEEGPNRNRFVVDALRGVAPPFDPQSVVKEYATLLKHYSIGNVVGDNYSAEWAVSAFAANGISYARSELNKSELYLEALPLFARGSVALPDHKKLVRELRLLERATHRSGRDTIDHPRGGSDDYANALCGMLNALHSLRFDESMSWVCHDHELLRWPWWMSQPALRGRVW